MRRSSSRPQSTPPASSSLSGNSRKFSKSAYGVGSKFSGCGESTVIDQGQLEGRIKIASTIKNPDVCLSVSYRPDGRFYAVALANGLINVYSTKTDNILYCLNNNGCSTLSDVSATSVQFRPFQLPQAEETSSLLSSISNKEFGSRRKSVAAGSTADSERFLPPLSNRLSIQSQQYLQSHNRRKSSVSAWGRRSLTDELGFVQVADKATPNNIVTASFTDGSIKTFNVLTEQCLNTTKENREILTIEYNRSGSLLATGGDNGIIHIYDDETNSLKSSYIPPFQYNTEQLRTYSISFHPESDFELVSGGWNRAIQLYDVRVPNLMVAKLQGPKVCGEGISFHPSGKEVCVAAWDKGEGVYYYDYSMRQRIQTANEKSNKPESISKSSGFGKHSMPSGCLYAARYFMNSYVIVCGTYPGSLAVVDRSSGNIFAAAKNLPQSIYGVDIFKSKAVFIVGNEVSRAEIYI